MKDELDAKTVQMELKALENNIRKYNNPQLGEIPGKHHDGTTAEVALYPLLP
jgi:hypothetical protein